MKTKNEYQLINLRKKRLKQLNCWIPTIEEFNQLFIEVIRELAKKYSKKRQQEIFKHVFLTHTFFKHSKFYEGHNLLFGEFIGKPKADKTAILPTVSRRIWLKNIYFISCSTKSSIISG